MGSKLRTAVRLVHQDVVAALHRPFRQRGQDPYHRVEASFHAQVNALDRPRILEIGSRNVTSPKGAFTVPFHAHTGFAIDGCEEGLPARVYSLVADRPTCRNRRYGVNQGVAMIATKTADYRSDLLRWDLDAAAVTATVYPPPG